MAMASMTPGPIRWSAPRDHRPRRLYVREPAAGDYVVVETDPPGYVSTTPNERSAVVSSGSTTANVNFGDQFPPPAQSITGLVWNDGNTNGSPDSGEPGIPGVVVALYQDLNSNDTVDPASRLPRSPRPDAGGSYSFTGIGAGDYVAVESDPPDYTSTHPTPSR